MELILPKTKPIIVGVCYRPPKQTDFYELLESICFKCNISLEKKCIIMGDFNTNLLLPQSSLIESLSYLCKVSGLQQLITEPTRLSIKSRSLLDLILVSDCGMICQSGVLDVAFSDHNAVFCTRKKIKSQPINEHCSIKYRWTKQYSAEVFNQRLSERDWSDLLESNDVDKAWDLFKQRFIAVLDEVAPLRETRINHRSASWMTSEIIDLVRQCNRCFLKFKKSKLPTDYNSYANLRNQISYIVQQAKSEFYSDSIAANSKQPKKQWKILSDVGSTPKSKAKSGKAGLIIGDEMCFDKRRIACHFNHYFTTAATSLVSKLPGASNKYGKPFVNSFYRSKNVSADAFTISPVSEDKVRASISTLSENKATGLDRIASRFLRDSAGVTSSILTHVINLSSQGVFSKDMKNARVVPLFKKNHRADVGKYRPVSILSTISKIFERLVYEQVEEYLIRHDLLYELQSGFRAAYSTDTCLIHLFDYVCQNLGLGNYVGMVLLDLQNHSIL